MRIRDFFKKKHWTLLGVSALIIVVFALNLLVQDLVNLRFDFTEDKKFSLSEDSKRILKDLENDVEIRFYFTQDNNEMPINYKNYARRVNDLLTEYEENSSHIKILRFNPSFQSDAADKALFDGLTPIKVVNGELLFCGIAVSCLDKTKLIGELSPSEESLLEYQLSRAILQVYHGKRPKISIVSPFAILGKSLTAEMAEDGENAVSGWKVFDMVKEDFQLKHFFPESNNIDFNVDLMILLHPTNLSEDFLINFDNFMQHGGNVLICVDPFSFLAKGISTQSKHNKIAESSDLKKIFKNWGIKFDSENVVGDNLLGRRVNNNTILTLVDYLSNNLSKEHITTNLLNHLSFPFGGDFIIEKKLPSLVYTPLVQTSLESCKYPQKDSTDTVKILANFRSSQQNLCPALAVTGEFPALFSSNISAEKQSSTAILIGDSDWLLDQICLQEVNENEKKSQQSLNDNMIFLQNILEFLSHKNALIGVRSRQINSRPLTRFTKMQADADEKFKDKILQKKSELDAANQIYEEIALMEQMHKKLITQKQRIELEKAQITQVNLIKEIKQATKELYFDVENLKNKITIICIGLIPLLLFFCGIAVMLFRNWRGRVK